MEITHEGSMALYNRLLKDPPLGPTAPVKRLRSNAYNENGKHVVAIVRSDDRANGIREAISLLGGLAPIVEGVQGEFLIKPNCNTDNPYPIDSHPGTVRAIVESLMGAGVQPDKIVLGETSGRARGLPTRQTMENLGMLAVAEDLGIGVCFFEEEEEWVTVKPPGAPSWPEGIKIPKRVYDAERVILTPIMRPHSTATFTISLKLVVGMLDSVGREWLHDGHAHHAKVVDLNLAYSADLIIADASKILVSNKRNSRRAAEPGIIIASGNRVASDAASVALMRLNGADKVIERAVWEHEQFKIAKIRDLGPHGLEGISLRILDLEGDPGFEDTVSGIRDELES
ncbi:hypothetical protein CL673_04595 [Candidatus Bathyarchaeota archaeon]|jgi:uncharacterized protein (DUF362 family)|nr:hypothetical protein [Candidatus Bathyarchaeota archaeon]MDP6047887.1 DUF362 domain-containing protein [Candidatus Bathyarchaeota archaeon]MDP7443417.1 DUF362 domain-containing protein [Candidatus Bathyarchaeota archaeon]|tara:strand:+ start:4602 stop:5627 length:1026 start_codon:yes stop_codon:yes gene_type:complete